MALSYTQIKSDYDRETSIHQAADQIINAKNVISSVRTQIQALYTEIDADANAAADLKTLANQANNFVNNANVTDFITFVQNQLES